MERSAHDGFINIDIAVPDFQVKTAIRIGANPGFVLNICPLTTEIGQGYQVSGLTTLTLGEIRLFHEVHLPTRIEFSPVYTTTLLLARVSYRRWVVYQFEMLER